MLKPHKTKVDKNYIYTTWKISHNNKLQKLFLRIYYAFKIMLNGRIVVIEKGVISEKKIIIH